MSGTTTNTVAVLREEDAVPTAIEVALDVEGAVMPNDHLRRIDWKSDLRV
jgi:hypothetical protein